MVKMWKFILPAALIAFVGCGQTETPPEQTQETPAQEAPVTQPEAGGGIPTYAGDTISTPSGLKYIEVTEGTGASPTTGQQVFAHYTGWLTNGTKFDSSRDRGQPFSFPIGQGRVIKGWDEGIASMKVGGRRMLIIPPDLGYGAQGAGGGVIPPGATLMFDVELLEVKDAGAGG